jgi:hypothetical protein
MVQIHTPITIKKNKILNGEIMNKENLVAIHSGSVFTKEQTEKIYELAKTPIDIDEKTLDKFNSIGCTSFLLTKEELEEIIKSFKR